MDALILSCSTGGGHNAAGYAIKEELESRGHRADMIDPYALVSEKVEHAVGNTYVKVAQYAPYAFGCVYQLAEAYRKLPVHSPVYWANKKMYEPMCEYLRQNHYDVIFFPHLYPGEMLTYIKSRGVKLPKLIFVATDYTCTPFTEEVDCDYCVIPTKKLSAEFEGRGIPKDKIVPLGIPVGKAFREVKSRDGAKQALGLDEGKRYILLSGGSIGGTRMYKAVRAIKQHIESHPDKVLIAVCGTDKLLYKNLTERYGGDGNIILLQKTDRMAEYMKACDVFIGKPGGLSSTEAAVTGVPLIHISPIPGCESKNIEYFSRHGMNIKVGNRLRILDNALELAEDEKVAAKMIRAQHSEINAMAAPDICDLAEKII